MQIFLNKISNLKETIYTKDKHKINSNKTSRFLDFIRHLDFAIICLKKTNRILIGFHVIELLQTQNSKTF